MKPSIQTFTGIEFFPFDPRPEQVCIEDIAHALANKCRYAGHTTRFYSVAEHSVFCTTIVEPDYYLQALLHDAAEAYLPDIPSPIKKRFPTLIEAEKVILATIGEALNVNLVSLPPEIKRADLAMLAAEREQVMSKGFKWSADNLPEPPAVVRLMCWSPEKAKVKFLKMLNFLMEAPA